MIFEPIIKIPQNLHKVSRIFSENGFKSYLVGGAVRDMLMKKEVNDYDIATDATPKDVMRIFHRVIPTGMAHGTVTIHFGGEEYETTTFRTESVYSDGRHPDNVSFASSIEEDLSRRDFTMNAIAVEIETGKIVDPFDGQKDIRNKLIRTVGNPLERFTEDGLRPVRAIRFASQLGFRIDEGTFDAITDPVVRKKTSGISLERFRDEFCKMLMTEKPSVALLLLERTGLMDEFISEFTVCRGCIQKDFRGFHEFDVADHCIYACDGAPSDNLIVRLAAFYHDIGKPEAKRTEIFEGKEVIHFHSHESYSAEKTVSSMTRLKFSNEEIRKVSHLVKEHMFFFEKNWTDAAVRRFLIRVGVENLDALFALRLADTYGMHNMAVDARSDSFRNIVELKKRIEKVAAEKNALSLKDLKVNGKDLMNLGIPHGKVIGEILKELFETVTDSPPMNDREKLLELAFNIWKSKWMK